VTRGTLSLVAVALLALAAAGLGAPYFLPDAAPPHASPASASCQHRYTRSALDAVSGQLEPSDYDRAARFVADCEQ